VRGSPLLLDILSSDAAATTEAGAGAATPKDDAGLFDFSGDGITYFHKSNHGKLERKKKEACTMKPHTKRTISVFKSYYAHLLIIPKGMVIVTV